MLLPSLPSAACGGGCGERGSCVIGVTRVGGLSNASGGLGGGRGGGRWGEGGTGGCGGEGGNLLVGICNSRPSMVSAVVL